MGKITIDEVIGPLHGLPNLSSVIEPFPGDKAKTDVSPKAPLYPNDKYNTELQANIHPNSYINPNDEEEYDLVVLGGGVAGLMSCIMSTWLGKKCALIEGFGLGGDCVNLGCIPSKSLIACAKQFHHTKTNLRHFGIHVASSNISLDFPFIMERMRRIRAEISAQNSIQKYLLESCHSIFLGHGRFVGRNVIEVTSNDSSTSFVCFKKAIITTGASAFIPPIPGLRETPHLTNANIFNLVELPADLLIIGCGPIGLELAQTFARFGSRVVCFEYGNSLMPREEPQAVALLTAALQQEGIAIHTGVDVLSVQHRESRGGSLFHSPWGCYKLTVRHRDGSVQRYQGDALLNCTGRSPNVQDIGLENVGVEWDNRRGVLVDSCFRSSHPDVYACGDCASPYKFTHSAEFQARAAIRNMFLGETISNTDFLIPWCTYTDPEIAHVGKYEVELRRLGLEFESFVQPLSAVDRCVCESNTSGFVKITVNPNTGQILGGTVCGANAGDMISEITLCMQYDINIAQLAGVMRPYPTTHDALRLCASQFYKHYQDKGGVPFRTLQLLMSDVGARDESNPDGFGSRK